MSILQHIHQSRNGSVESFQIGGKISESDKKNLFPFFAYTYSKEINPDKYGSLSMEEWISAIQNNEEDIKQITEIASSLSNEDWEQIKLQYNKAMDTNKVELAAKGAKLKKLKEVDKAISNPTLTAKNGTEMKKKLAPKDAKKKCSCGCNLILSKAEGGKVIETCACKCGGKMKKKK